MSIDKLNSEIDSLKKQIAELEEQKQKLTALSEDQELAIELHDQFCRWNHTDGCSWFYNGKRVGDVFVPTWTDASQDRYLTMARRLLSRFTIVEIRLFLKCIKE